MECPGCGHDSEEHSREGCSAEGCPCVNTRDDVVSEVAAALGVDEDVIEELGDEIEDL